MNSIVNRRPVVFQPAHRQSPANTNAAKLLCRPLYNKGVAEGLGAAIAIGTRRAANWAGSKVLGIDAPHAPRRLNSPQANGRLPVRMPAASTQLTSRSGRPRFFSVT